MITNKKLSDYKSIERYTAGMVLTSSQLSDIKWGKCELAASWVDFSNGKVILRQVKFHGNEVEIPLMLNKTEIRKINKHLQQPGYTVIPSKILYLKSPHNEKKHFKIEIAIAIGLKEYDKRDQIKKRENDINLKRLTKG